MSNTIPTRYSKYYTHLEYNIEWHSWQKIEVRLQSRSCVLELRIASELVEELGPLGQGQCIDCAV